MQKVTLDWLSKTDFYARTGLCSDHVRFCLEREDKKSICEEIGITHSGDDRIHVMQILRGTVPNLILFTPPEDKRYAPGFVTHAGSWGEVLEAIATTSPDP